MRKNIITNKLQNFQHGFTTIARNLANNELRKKNRAKVMYLSQMTNDKKGYDLKSERSESYCWD